MKDIIIGVLILIINFMVYEFYHPISFHVGQKLNDKVNLFHICLLIISLGWIMYGIIGIIK